jgi:hypothetical protein
MRMSGSGAGAGREETVGPSIAAQVGDQTQSMMAGTAEACIPTKMLISAEIAKRLGMSLSTFHMRWWAPGIQLLQAGPLTAVHGA